MLTTVGASRRLATSLLTAAGMAGEPAERTAWALVVAELWDRRSHGLLRLPYYLQRFEAGGFDAAARLSVVRDQGAVIAYDGGDGLGHPQLWEAAEEAAARAERFGIAAASVGRSGHCGVLGLYVLPAIARGLVGLAVSNGPAVMPPWGGSTPLVSTSPIAAGFPSSPRPIVVDLATSAVARGKIAQAAAAGERIPVGWAFDGQGRPTDDPAAALSGMLAPMAGAKGFVLALVVEALTGAIVGPNLSTEVADPLSPTQAGRRQSLGHLVVVLDPALLDVDGSYRRRLDELAAAVVASGGRLPGSGHPLPDEIADDDVLQLDDALVRRLGEEAAARNVAMPAELAPA